MGWCSFGSNQDWEEHICEKMKTIQQKRRPNRTICLYIAYVLFCSCVCINNKSSPFCNRCFFFQIPHLHGLHIIWLEEYQTKERTRLQRRSKTVNSSSCTSHDTECTAMVPVRSENSGFAIVLLY
jgi:hypothetical protein